MPLERTLVGDEDDEEDDIIINHHTPASNLHGEDIPFSNEFSDTANLTPLVSRNTVVQLEEERPDTGMNLQLLGIKYSTSVFQPAQLQADA